MTEQSIRVLLCWWIHSFIIIFCVRWVTGWRNHDFHKLVIWLNACCGFTKWISITQFIGLFLCSQKTRYKIILYESNNESQTYSRGGFSEGSTGLALLLGQSPQQKNLGNFYYLFRAKKPLKQTLYTNFLWYINISKIKLSTASEGPECTIFFWRRPPDNPIRGRTSCPLGDSTASATMLCATDPKYPQFLSGPPITRYAPTYNPNIC